MLKQYTKSLGVFLLLALFIQGCTGLAPKTETIEDKIAFTYATINGIVNAVDTLVVNGSISKSKALG